MRLCDFVIVSKTSEHSRATVADGDGTCPFSDCNRVINGDIIKQQAQTGHMGEQIFAVVFKRRIETRTKTGKVGRTRWERGYRAPRDEDDNHLQISARLAEKLEEWDALDYVPSEEIGALSNYDRGHRMYGMLKWRDFSNPRQLLCHGEGVAIFNEMWQERSDADKQNAINAAAFVYLSITIDTTLNYGSRACRWDIVTETCRSVFDRHGFAMLWSYSEMAPLVNGLGYDWAAEKTKKCIAELVALTHGNHSENNDLFLRSRALYTAKSEFTISCKPGEALDHISDASVDVVVMDPPYYDNVMYAELSDFFYVWLTHLIHRSIPHTQIIVPRLA